MSYEANRWMDQAMDAADLVTTCPRGHLHVPSEHGCRQCEIIDEGDVDTWICSECGKTTNEPAFTMDHDMAALCPSCPVPVELGVNPEWLPRTCELATLHMIAGGVPGLLRCLGVL